MDILLLSVNDASLAEYVCCSSRMEIRYHLVGDRIPQYRVCVGDDQDWGVECLRDDKMNWHCSHSYTGRPVAGLLCSSCLSVVHTPSAVAGDG